MNFLALIFAYLGLYVGMIFLWSWYRNKRPVKLPFTEDFRNQPGKSLLEKLNDLEIDAVSQLSISYFLPFILLGILHQVIALEKYTVFIIFGGLVAWIALVVKFFKTAVEIRNYRLGYLGEVYVGQCLMPLVAKRYRLFHDYPGREFNIDHVAIGPEGIFSVETKARRKPDRKGGAADTKVRVDGDVLYFPGWKDTESIPQAKRQASWLARELTKEMAETLNVVPVLAVPGWYIDTSADSSILVCNGREMEKILPKWGKDTLTRDQLIKLVSFFRRQCSYRPDKKTGKSS